VCVGVPTYQCAQVAVTAGSASAAAMAWQLLAQTGQAPARSKSDRPRRGRGGGAAPRGGKANLAGEANGAEAEAEEERRGTREAGPLEEGRRRRSQRQKRTRRVGERAGNDQRRPTRGAHLSVGHSEQVLQGGGQGRGPSWLVVGLFV
jgi:hypothetical protein